MLNGFITIITIIHFSVSAFANININYRIESKEGIVGSSISISMADTATVGDLRKIVERNTADTVAKVLAAGKPQLDTTRLSALPAYSFISGQPPVHAYFIMSNYKPVEHRFSEYYPAFSMTGTIVSDGFYFPQALRIVNSSSFPLTVGGLSKKIIAYQDGEAMRSVSCIGAVCNYVPGTSVDFPSIFDNNRSPVVKRIGYQKFFGDVNEPGDAIKFANNRVYWPIAKTAGHDLAELYGKWASPLVVSHNGHNVAINTLTEGTSWIFTDFGAFYRQCNTLGQEFYYKCEGTIRFYRPQEQTTTIYLYNGTNKYIAYAIQGVKGTTKTTLLVAVLGLLGGQIKLDMGYDYYNILAGPASAYFVNSVEGLTKVEVLREHAIKGVMLAQEEDGTYRLYYRKVAY